MAGQFEPLPGVGDLGAVDFQDGEILVEVIADKQIFSVGRVNAAPSGRPPNSTSPTLVTFLPSIRQLRFRLSAGSEPGVRQREVFSICWPSSNE